MHSHAAVPHCLPPSEPVRDALPVCVFRPQVFDGAVIVLSLAPMVASTVANSPSSPWDAISLIITLRIWRVKRIIDGETGQAGWGSDSLLLSLDSWQLSP